MFLRNSGRSSNQENQNDNKSMRRELLSLACGNLQLDVDADLGGHIAGFRINGKNALLETGPEIGSTFWPAPQEAWGWPPPRTLDKAPYEVITTRSGIRLQSADCPETGLRLQKHFELHRAGMRVVYEMVNITSRTLHYGPWEITRLAGGVTFYDSDVAPMAISTGRSIIQGGTVWHRYQPQRQSHHEKIFGNGSQGWVANANQGLLLLKRFAPVAAHEIAPGEAEIEIYAHGDAVQPYIEMEQQGAYQRLQPKQKLTWPVDWYLTELPANMTPEIGDERLVELARTILHGAVV